MRKIVYDDHHHTIALRTLNATVFGPSSEPYNLDRRLNIYNPERVMNETLTPTRHDSKPFEDYINLVLHKGVAVYQNIYLTFEKLKIANEVFSLLNNSEMDSENKKLVFLELYKKALNADGIKIGSRTYPAGRLGKALVEYRCTIEPAFAVRHSQDLDMEKTFHLYPRRMI